MKNVRKYRRDGTPYPPGPQGVLEWSDDFDDLTLRRVRFGQLPDGSQVSTVWIGIDLASILGFVENLMNVPLIFETVVLDPEGNIIWEERWATEKEATIGHLKIMHAMQREDRARKDDIR